MFFLIRRKILLVFLALDFVDYLSQGLILLKQSLFGFSFFLGKVGFVVFFDCLLEFGLFDFILKDGFDASVFESAV